VRRYNAGTPYTYRFRVPEGERIEIDDLIRGKVGWDTDTLGDFVAGPAHSSSFHLNSVSGLVSKILYRSRSTNQSCPFRKSHRPTRRLSDLVDIAETIYHRLRGDIKGDQSPLH